MFITEVEGNSFKKLGHLFLKNPWLETGGGNGR